MKQQVDLLQSNLKFNNVVPIVISAIMVTASAVTMYAAIDKRLALLEQKQDQMIAQNIEILNKISPLYTRIGLAESDIKVLQSEHRNMFR